MTTTTTPASAIANRYAIDREPGRPVETTPWEHTDAEARARVVRAVRPPLRPDPSSPTRNHPKSHQMLQTHPSTAPDPAAGGAPSDGTADEDRRRRVVLPRLCPAAQDDSRPPPPANPVAVTTQKGGAALRPNPYRDCPGCCGTPSEHHGWIGPLARLRSPKARRVPNARAPLQPAHRESLVSHPSNLHHHPGTYSPAVIDDKYVGRNHSRQTSSYTLFKFLNCPQVDPTL